MSRETPHPDPRFLQSWKPARAARSAHLHGALRASSAPFILQADRRKPQDEDHPRVANDRDSRAFGPIAAPYRVCTITTNLASSVPRRTDVPIDDLLAGALLPAHVPALREAA